MFSVQDLKRWHWLIIGLVIGALLGTSRALWPIDPAGRNLKQDQFEALLIRRQIDDPEMIDMVVHPADDGSWIVTGHVWHPQSSNAADASQLPAVWFKADNPYVPRDNADRGGASAGGTVVDYLGRLQAAGLILPFRVAWWEKPATTIALWSIGGTVALGIIWPALLALLVGAGLGRRAPETPYDLDRFKSRLAEAKARPGLSEADRAKLAELEAQLEAQLSGMGAAGQDGKDAGEQKAAPALGGDRLAPAAAPAEAGEEKKFGLEPRDYYPTAIHVPKNGDGGAQGV